MACGPAMRQRRIAGLNGEYRATAGTALAKKSLSHIEYENAVKLLSQNTSAYDSARRHRSMTGVITVAQKVEVTLVDDLDGGAADETVSFAIDGASYEIDLSGKNAQKLRDAVTPFLGAARKVGRVSARSGGRGRSGGSATVDREQNQAIREWAKKKGLNVSERGRIPQEIVERYHAER
jgi:hypothetical protein